jgi:segregation and condensation protein B
MELKFILESILFSAQKPLSPKECKEVLAAATEHSDDEAVRACKRTRLEKITAALEELAQEHESAGRSYRLVAVAGSWQFVSQPEFAPWIKALVGHKARAPRLSQPALETLAIIAYRQPLTRAEIEQVRGVAADGVLATLIDRGLIEQVGRADLPGRPMTYGTTPFFLEYFGLKNLDGLPASDELRRTPVEKPESLLTVDPGLATAPPEQLTVVEPRAPQAKEPAAHAPPEARPEIEPALESNDREPKE